MLNFESSPLSLIVVIFLRRFDHAGFSVGITVLVFLEMRALQVPKVGFRTSIYLDGKEKKRDEIIISFRWEKQ